VDCSTTYNSFTETHIIETLCSGCVLVVLIELGVAFIDLVILSFATEDCDIADIKRLWGVLEEFVDQGKIDSLGISRSSTC
jgi:diketogulonate reductase-like aldo/keto reductase